MRIPWNIEQAKRLGIVLDRYKQDNFAAVLIGVFVTYILYPFVAKNRESLCNNGLAKQWLL